MTDQTSPQSAPQEFRTAIAAAIALFGFVLIFTESFRFGSDAAFFPRIIAIVGALSSISVLMKALRQSRAARRGGETPNGAAELSWADFVISYVTPVIYAVLLYLIGFWIASMICLMSLMVLMGERKWLVMTSITAGTLLTIYAVFNLGFNIRMPAGLLVEMLTD